MIVRDQLQREIVLKSTPQSIVSLVPSQTELICDLGLQPFLRGVTKFCVHPENIRKIKKVVGGTKRVHPKKIATLNPDIILCNKEENTREMVQELTPIAPVHVSNVVTFNDSLDLISKYGEIFEMQDLSARLIKDLERAKKDFETSVSKEPLKVAYFIWKNPWMVAGGETFINTLLEINGWKNIYKDNGRYPKIEIKDLEVTKPDLVLLSSEPYPFKKSDRKELEEHLRVKVQLVDGEYFSWYGSRLLPAFNYFREFQMKLSNLL